MKIAYAGFDLLSPALRILDGLGCEFYKIYTCKTDNITEFNTDVKNFAAQRGIPCTDKRIDRADIEELIKNNCDLLISAAYYHKIPTAPRLAAVNIHPSKLPEGRGAWPMPWAILNHLPEGGVTLHKLTDKFDEGDILLQSTFPLSGEDDHKTYMEKVCAALPPMLEKLVSDLPTLLKNAQPQTKGEYLTAPTERDFTVYSHMTVKEADRILRAFFGYECIYKTPDSSYEIIGGRAEKNITETILKLKDGAIIADRIRKLD